MSDRLPKGLMDTVDLISSLELQETIYHAYARAIARRGRVPLEQDRFQYHFFEGGNHDRSFLEETLRKMPSWHTIDLPNLLTANFHTGESLQKKLMYNDYFCTEEGQVLAMQAVAHFMGNYTKSDPELVEIS